MTTTFREGGDRAKALSAWAAIAAVGLLAGGILTESWPGLAWQWIFLIDLPIGIAAIAPALRYVPESRKPTTGVDVRGRSA